MLIIYFVKCSFVIAILLIIFILERTNTCDCIYKSCAKSFLREASLHNIVIASIVSKKYILQIKNYWISSAIPNNFTNIVFIASDYKTFCFCKSLTKYVLMGRLVMNQTEEIKFMNKDFEKITLSRLEIIYTILSFGMSLLVNDIDIFLYKNPLPYIMNYSEDIISSVDSPAAINVGF